MATTMTLGDSDKAQAKAVSADVDAMSAFLGKQFRGELDRRALNFDGFSGSRTQVERRLAHYKHHLSRFMQDVPRDPGETLDAWRARIAQRKPDSHGVFSMIESLEAHLLREAEKERVAARQAEAQSKAEEQRQRAELERSASPDPDEIRRLLSRIESAGEAEKLLANIMSALVAHYEAEDARKRLRSIYDYERRACERLGRRAPPRRDVPAAPKGACDFAAVITRANRVRG